MDGCGILPRRKTAIVVVTVSSIAATVMRKVRELTGKIVTFMPAGPVRICDGTAPSFGLVSELEFALSPSAKCCERKTPAVLRPAVERSRRREMSLRMQRSLYVVVPFVLGFNQKDLVPVRRQSGDTTSGELNRRPKGKIVVIRGIEIDSRFY